MVETNEVIIKSIHDQLEGVERFNPGHLEQLENFIQENHLKFFDLNISLAILKYYQFNLSLLKLDIIQLIIIDAMCQLPENHFTLCLCLLPYSLLVKLISAKKKKKIFLILKIS